MWCARRPDIRALVFVACAVAALSVVARAQSSDSTATREREAQSASDRGADAIRAADYDSALAHFDRALPLYRDLRDADGEAYTLAAIGVLYQALGDPQKA